MLNVLIAGKVIVQPQERRSAAGKSFVTTTVACATGGEGDTTASVIAFSESARNALLALSKGDAVCLTGRATPKVYAPANGEPRASLDVVAEAVLTQYQLKQKRDASQPKPQTDPPDQAARQRQFKAAAEAQAIGDLPDDLPW